MTNINPGPEPKYVLQTTTAGSINSAGMASVGRFAADNAPVPILIGAAQAMGYLPDRMSDPMVIAAAVYLGGVLVRFGRKLLAPYSWFQRITS